MGFLGGFWVLKKISGAFAGSVSLQNRHPFLCPLLYLTNMKPKLPASPMQETPKERSRAKRKKESPAQKASPFVFFFLFSDPPRAVSQFPLSLMGFSSGVMIVAKQTPFLMACERDRERGLEGYFRRGFRRLSPLFFERVFSHFILSSSLPLL